jgi:hypothetical protein
MQLISNMRAEYYPLWMKAHPELFAKSMERFMDEAKEANLSTIKEYWHCGLFYIEAS